jgi:hypothetical protein
MNKGPHERGAAVAELPCRDVACYVSQHPHLKKSFAGHAGSAEGAQLCSPGREAWESVIDDSSPGGATQVSPVRLQGCPKRRRLAAVGRSAAQRHKPLAIQFSEPTRTLDQLLC